MTITLALPSKGRLKEQALEVLRKAGLEVLLPSDQRNYRAQVAGEGQIDILFLSASEIARELGYGSVDLGVTGEDLVRETLSSADDRVQIEARLGFGHADVIVAVPEVWYDVSTMADLDDVAADFRQRHGRRLRIATKYWRLTQQFFSQMHGIQVYRIVESLGATEGAPASRVGRYHRRYYIDRVYAACQSAQNSGRWRHPEVAGMFDFFACGSRRQGCIRTIAAHKGHARLAVNPSTLCDPSG